MQGFTCWGFKHSYMTCVMIWLWKWLLRLYLHAIPRVGSYTWHSTLHGVKTKKFQLGFLVCGFLGCYSIGFGLVSMCFDHQLIATKARKCCLGASWQHPLGMLIFSFLVYLGPSMLLHSVALGTIFSSIELVGS